MDNVIKGVFCMIYNKISGFSDEIASDIITQFEVLNKLGIKYYEPRFVDEKNISELNDEEVVELKSNMDKYGIKASSIGSPVGKVKLTDDLDKHFELFKRVVKTAKMLDCKFVRMFSFYHEGGEWTEDERGIVLTQIKKMINYAKQENIVLLHENEKDIYGDTAERCKDLMDNLYCDNFKAVFDPANFVQCGQDTKDAFEILEKYIAYMHIKDARFLDKAVVPAGMGDGNVPYILEKLFNKGYNSFLSLEPHLGHFKGLDDLETDDLMKDLPEGGEGTFTLAFNTLNKIIMDKKLLKVRLGVVGYGNMGSAHVRNIMGGKVPGMVIGAVCDHAEARRNALKEAYPEIPAFENAEDLFESGLCDAVIIAVYHYDHPRLVIKALECGLNVITEKPAGVYTKQVKEMNDAAAKSDKLFGIMYNQRTNPVYQKIKKMIEDGELGGIKRVTWIVTNWYRCQAYHDSSTWRSTWATEGGGALINQNPHQLDLWQWMFGMPDRIYAKAGFGKFYDIEVEDEVIAFMEYDNGISGQYIASTGEAPGTNRLEIACDMGKIVVEDNKIIFDRNVMSEREFNKTNEVPFGRPENWKCEIPADFSGGEQHVGIFKNFTSALLNETPLLAPGEEGINGLTISNAMHLSAWTGETVDVKNFPDDKFYELLQEKIKNSTVKKAENNTVSNTEGTY